MPEEEAARDFFVSYNKADIGWATGLAGWLREAGYSFVMQQVDFAPGSNFILEMDKAARSSKRTIAVLSPDYLAAGYTQPEWAAAFASDPTGARRRLIPVRIRECEPSGLLGQIVYIDLVGLTVGQAREKFLEGVGQSDISTGPPLAPHGPADPEAQKGGNRVSIHGNVTSSIVANVVKISRARKASPRVAYPAGSIGADLDRKNYVQYLIGGYNEFKQADKSFGVHSARPFSHAVTYTSIERRFKCKTYFIRVERFLELVEYLHALIDRTILGKRNRSRGTRNYESFEEYAARQRGSEAD